MKFTYSTPPQTVTIGAAESGTIMFRDTGVPYVTSRTSYDDVTEAEGETDQSQIVVTFLPYTGNTLSYTLASGPAGDITLSSDATGGFSATCNVPSSGSTEWVLDITPQAGGGDTPIKIKAKQKT